MGRSVSNAGDVNGDGLDDLIVGNEESNINGKPIAGKSYVVFGKKDNTNAMIEWEYSSFVNSPIIIKPPVPVAMADNSTASVSCLPNTTYDVSDVSRALNAGDVNGDGLDDLIVGNEESNINGKPNAGKSYVVFGKKDNTNAIELSDIVAGLVLSFLPNTTYDLPADRLPLGSAL
jgi:hypothetical protein